MHRGGHQAPLFVSSSNMEALVKKDGRWWVKIKDDPKEAAANFKQLFAK